MRRATLRSSVAALMLVATAFPALAQQITRVTPAIGAPGDVVLISGMNLGGVTMVRFNAFIGGVVGFEVHQVVPAQVTATLVTAVVPVIGTSRAPNGSTPFGGVGVTGPAFSNQAHVLLLRADRRSGRQPGLGTTAGGLNGRQVVGFTIAGGPPAAGNPLFTLTLENATPSATALLAVGAPATLGATYLDGFIGIDLTLPFQLLPAPMFTVNASGDVTSAFRSRPVPSTSPPRSCG